jgi:heterodisulfide reductase subunit B
VKGEFYMDNNINLTEEIINNIIETYQSNKETINEMQKKIDEFGYLDNGLTDIYESFEMGYNNALEYVASLLGISNLLCKSNNDEDDEISKIENEIEKIKEEIDYEKRKMECCGYGKSDLLYLEELEDKLEKLENLLDEL